MSGGRWVLRIDGAADGPTNMTADHALARALEPGTAHLRLYAWSVPTVSFGRNEPVLETYDRTVIEERGLEVVRRPTGGRAVLHHREVTYAVAAPIRLFGGLKAAYAAINGALARGLERLGVRVALASPTGVGDGASRGPGLQGGACFGSPTAGEVVADGRKLVGSAQVRIGDALLQHGSVLLEDDQAVIDAIRGAGVSSDARPARGSCGLAELLGTVPRSSEVVEALASGFRAEMAGGWTSEASPLDLPRDLLVRYRSSAWTWRR